MKRSILYSFVCMLLVMTACVDDEIRPFDDIPEGETTVSMAVEFNPLTPALATRAAAGDAIKSIESLCVLVYDASGKFLNRYTKANFQNYQLNENTPREDETGKDAIAESTTPSAKFNLKLPYGTYRIYAVANMGDLSEYDVETVDKLKGISLTWQEDVKKNNQMLGHFTEAKTYTDDDKLIINRKNMELRAGIRRVASKVTLAFDGSQLAEGVFVYIKSVQIKDIPKTCFLGDKNTPTNADQLQAGDTIKYDLQSSFDENYVARLTKGRPYYPHDDDYGKKFHTETERALYFYENMQGVHEDNDKRQDANGDGALDHPGTTKEDPTYLAKDGVPCGTYIEVDAYYRSINEERLGSGDIKYRFMLGKNVTTDYDAERNHHYKLTLKFKNFANDADWHIDYKEPASIIVPEPYYISYLYNHKVMLPVKVNTGGRKLISLEAEIDTNSWAPYNAPLLDYYRDLDPNVTLGAPLNAWNGFLSLKRTKLKVLTDTEADKNVVYANQKNEEYWNQEAKGNRAYQTTSGEYESDEGNGKYYVSTDENGDVNFSIPLYTRAKQLYVKTAYTGNNPYVAYQRKANVKFTAKLDDGTTLKQNARVMQVRRVVNPKGIWRRHDSDADFHVVLKRLPRESATDFEEFTSEGKWKAYPVVDKTDLIKLDGVNGTDTVQGSTGTLIDFTIHFNGKCNENENRCAIIRVEYHDYSCFHLIFVRQGSAPMDLVGDGKTYWHANNMHTIRQEAGCPLEEGSLFKFGNWWQAIDAVNNVDDGFADNGNTTFQIVGNDNAKWSGIWNNSENTEFAGDGPKITASIPGKTVSVAAYEDFEALYLSDKIENAYGVMYGNDATATKDNIDDVYGHRYDRHGSGYGMRGVFAYNLETGDNLFFPIGASGFGHRKHEDNGNTAVLRYSGISNIITSNIAYRPLFYDLYRRPGAIYWLRKKEGSRSADAIGWDINYFTFDFNFIDKNNLFHNGKSDACFVRCVEK